MPQEKIMKKRKSNHKRLTTSLQLLIVKEIN